MWLRQTIGAVSVLGLAAVTQLACSGTTPMDQNFGTEAGSNFEAPIATEGADGSADTSAEVDPTLDADSQDDQSNNAQDAGQ
jgi:hypothetical protein